MSENLDLRFDEISTTCLLAQDAYRATHAALSMSAANVQLDDSLRQDEVENTLDTLRKQDEKAQLLMWDAILEAVEGECTHIVRGAFNRIVYAGTYDACREAVKTRVHGGVVESLCPLHHRYVWDYTKCELVNARHVGC